MYDYARAQRVAHRQIAKFGASPSNPLATGYLRRNAQDRACTVAVIEYSAREQGLRLQGSRRALISAVDLSVPPDMEEDLLIANGEVLRIVSPVQGPRPAGVSIFYDAEVQYQSADGA